MEYTEFNPAIYLKKRLRELEEEHFELTLMDPATTVLRNGMLAGALSPEEAEARIAEQKAAVEGRIARVRERLAVRDTADALRHTSAALQSLGGVTEITVGLDGKRLAE